jgi:FkbM family methyltransferase
MANSCEHRIGLRQALKSTIGGALAVLLRTPAGAKLYERIFDASPHRIADLMVRLQSQPRFDLMWTTQLLNGGKVRIPVRAGDSRSWEFAHAYHWHDVDIRDLEYVLLREFVANRVATIVFDIGANMGLRSLLPLSMGLRCVLFEPNPELRDFTTELFALNDFRDYELHNLCLSDRTGAAPFYISANSYMSSLDRAWLADNGPIREIEVPVTTFDDWISKRPELAQRPSVIKIDVEGAELQVLEGAREYIGRRRPPIICEIATNSGIRARIWDYCQSLHYGIHSIHAATAQRAPAIARSSFTDLATETNFLLAPWPSRADGHEGKHNSTSPGAADAFDGRQVTTRLIGDKTTGHLREALKGARLNTRLVKDYLNGLILHEETRPFIVFGLMRSGTTLFGDLLAQHPDLTWLGEPFDQRIYCPILYLHGVTQAAPTDCAGLKIFPFQFSKRTDPPGDVYDRYDLDRGHRILDALRKKWKFFYLVREDFFAQCVSFTRANQTGIWHRAAGLGTGDHNPIRLDLLKFEQHLNHLRVFRDYAHKLFSETEMLWLTYEADLQDPQGHQATADRAFRFLGLPTISVSSKLERIGLGPLDRQIENYDEVARLAWHFGVIPTR